MSRAQENRLSPAARVTRTIEHALSQGVRPWAKPWRDGAAASGALALPRRANGECYRGMNVVALWAAAAERGFRSPHWFTFKQALTLGANIRKGERGSYVVFYKPVVEISATDNEEKHKDARSVL